MESSLHSNDAHRLHVAIIMDGNGRWGSVRGLPREAGHYAGINAFRDVAKAAAENPQIGTLTVYAFSSDNWRRPANEVAALMTIISGYLESELPGLVRAGVRLNIIGRRDRVSEAIVARIQRAEEATANGTALNLRVAIDYSGRDAIIEAAIACAKEGLSRDALSKRLAHGSGAPDVDLLIRTSGEQRLSDFLLWEMAYAELYFCDLLWPDFRAADLEDALKHFFSRDRRFGGASRSACDGSNEARDTAHRLAS